MQELSMNILDVAKNSVRARARLIEIRVSESERDDSLVIAINDDGCGMSAEQVRAGTDPFYTTRTTRKVGLGVPLFKMSAEMAGGSFTIDSAPGKGTDVKASYVRSHIDRMPLGDVGASVLTLIQGSPEIDFVYTYQTDRGSFCADTREFRKVLAGVPLDTPEVLDFIRAYIAEHTAALQ